MPSFSQRMGYTNIRDAYQIESMDQPLRNGLWNVVYCYFILPSNRENELIERRRKVALSFIDPGPRDFIPQWLVAIWLDYRHFTYDEVPREWRKARSMFRSWFLDCPWYETYDVIELLAQHWIDHDVDEEFEVPGSFISECNEILDKHWAGYNIVDGKVSPILEEAEVEQIESASSYSGPLSVTSEHIQRALELLSDRTAPDFRNSIKESISAVESACRAITGGRRDVLSKSLRKLEERGVMVHPAMREAFEKLYAYAGDADGIRHAMTESSRVDKADAQFMLVSCSAFVNYLVGKATAAGIDFRADDAER